MVRNQNPHRNSPDCSPYISFENSFENLVWDQSALPLVINFNSNSHNLYSRWSADVVRRKLMLVTLGPKGLMEKGKTFKYMGRQGSFYGNWGVEAPPPLQMSSFPLNILLSLQYISNYIGKIIQTRQGQCTWSISKYSLSKDTICDEEHDHDYKN